MPVFESPDGGNTVYQRDSGSTVRELVKSYDSRTPDGRPLYDLILEDQLWRSIRRAADTNPALQDVLERAIMVYHLTNTK